MQAYLHYGASRYPQKLSESTQAKFQEFTEACRVELSKKSGGFNLANADITQVYVAGNGWSVEKDGVVPRK